MNWFKKLFHDCKDHYKVLKAAKTRLTDKSIVYNVSSTK